MRIYVYYVYTLYEFFAISCVSESSVCDNVHVFSYLDDQINEGGGKEIRCPAYQCFKLVPDVSENKSYFV